MGRHQSATTAASETTVAVRPPRSPSQRAARRGRRAYHHVLRAGGGLVLRVGHQGSSAQQVSQLNSGDAQLQRHHHALRKRSGYCQVRYEGTMDQDLRQASPGDHHSSEAHTQHALSADAADNCSQRAASLRRRDLTRRTTCE